MDKYPTHRCKECTLVRCHYEQETCEECLYHAREPKQLEFPQHKCNFSYNPTFHPFVCNCPK